MTIVANLVVLAVEIYLVAGLLFAIPFVARGVDRIDPVVRESSWGFRLIILPGVVALWPVLARRWITGMPPREERNPHRDAARRSRDEGSRR